MPPASSMVRVSPMRSAANLISGEVATMSEAAETPADIPPFRYTAAMAGEIEARWQRRIGHKGLDLAEMGDAHRRAAAEFCRVRDQHDAAGVGDDGLRRLHLAIVEV